MISNKISFEEIIQSPINKITIHEKFYDPVCAIDNMIIIDIHYTLVSGLRTLKAYQAQGYKTIPAIQINFQKLIQVLHYLEHCDFLSLPIESAFAFPISYRAAISLAFEKSLKNQSSLVSEFKLHEFIAKVFGFACAAEVALAQKIYLQAPVYLIEEVDRGRISVQAAAAILESPEAMEAVYNAH